VNYAESFWGSDPYDPFSHPPTGEIRITVNSGGSTESKSFNYANRDAVGGAFTLGESQSATYTMRSDMSVYY
jgi:hypothetical protein